MTATSGCADSGMNEIKVPGNYDYAIQIKKDRDVVEPGGTYIYGPEGSAVHKLRGVRGGYVGFYELTLDFKCKDGREYHERIDVRPLILEMINKHDIPDMTKTKWGGNATLIIQIERDLLKLYYEVSEYIKRENPDRMLSEQHSFPVFEKKLN